MSDGPRIRRVFRLPGRRGRLRQEVDEELAFHVDMRIEDLIAEGLSTEEAEAEARKQFGDVQEVRRACRRIGIRREGEMKLMDSLDRLRQDVRFSLRQFVKAPLVSALAIGTLAIGIGAGTVVFTVVDAVVLDAVPLENADELYALQELTPALDAFSTSEPNFLDWRERQRSFTDITAYTWGPRTYSTVTGSERLQGLRVTHSFIPVLGLEVLLGRNIRPDEDQPGGPVRVVLLSEGFWETRLGADPGVIGTALTLDGEPYDVVGVVRSDRAFADAEIFTPLAPDPNTSRGNHMLSAMGRLSPGVTPEQAREDVRAIAAQLADEYPVNSGWGGTIEPLRNYMVGTGTIQVGTFLLGAVGLLLLMACGSVSNLLIARATGRRREMGLRAALGAGRQRILRQLVTESAVLGLAGAGLGVFLAWIGLPIVKTLGPGDLQRLAEASVDGRVLSFAAAASVLSVVIFGLAPALFVTRGGLFNALRESSPSSSSGRRLRDALVSAQFGLAIVVVLGAGLMVRSFAQIQNVDLGFEPQGALQFGVSVPDGQFSEAERVIFLSRLSDEIEALPGVQAVGVTMSPPFADFRATNHVASVDNMPDRQEDFLPVSWRAVDGGYFPATGVDLVAGRTFGSGDGWPGLDPPEDWQPSVVIDATLAQDLWGRLDVVGEEVVWGDPEGGAMRVVGVVEIARDERVEGTPRPRIYLPYDMFPWPEPTIVVRAGVDVAGLMPAIRGIVNELDGRVPIAGATPLTDSLRDAVAWPRFTMQVLAAFGLVAILLAAMGIYGVTAFNVQRRTRELGIRVALGAEPGRVLGIVMRGGIRLAAVGLGGGLLVALLMTRYIEDLLFEVPVHDAGTWILMPLGLGAVALLATWLPALRATRVDPKEALASE